MSSTSYTYLLITSRSGSLIYHLSLSPPSSSPALTTNDYLRIGSTLHSLKAITSQCSPVPGDGGMRTVDFGEGRMRVMQTETGMMFVLAARGGGAHDQTMAHCLTDIYAAWADWVVKNPFWEVDMPARGSRFGEEVKAICQRH
mmetsp:Transcript_26521/g.55295  ORF Transcript_26521/g.55295 Transcript_26521/m.55295 type:complete len:143 (-) Transcript_26521:48-476(-)